MINYIRKIWRKFFKKETSHKEEFVYPKYNNYHFLELVEHVSNIIYKNSLIENKEEYRYRYKIEM